MEKISVNAEGPFHEFIIVSSEEGRDLNFTKYLSLPSSLKVSDDLLMQIWPVFKDIHAYDPILKKDLKGLNLYGPTVLDKRAVKDLRFALEQYTGEHGHIFAGSDSPEESTEMASLLLQAGKLKDLVIRSEFEGNFILHLGV